jgi:SulP family sulfate permease
LVLKLPIYISRFVVFFNEVAYKYETLHFKTIQWRKDTLKIGTFRFDRVEFAGSLGDLGTLIPLSVAMIMVAGLSVTPVLLMIGAFYILSGLYYKLPIPVQPLKVVAAIAIAYPEKVSLPIIAASGILFGLILLFLAFTGLIDWLAKFFTKPVVRGIQLGLGFILMNKGISLILRPELFINNSLSPFCCPVISMNTAIGIAGFLIALLLLSNRRYPAALVLVFSGIILGFFYGSLDNIDFSVGPTSTTLYWPEAECFLTALFLLVIPQLPLTLGNAVMGTADTCKSLFGKGPQTRRVTYRALASTMGITNIFAGLLGAMPMCHGAGGLAAHYRFGARTGGSNLMIGICFLTIALAFGKTGISLLSAIPNSILGVLLLFAGLELALLVRDVSEKEDLFISLLIAGIGFATTNMGIAFVAGMVVMRLIRWRRIRF